MCEYIKDNGEQCGRTAKPYCHDHEDTPQAKLWGRQDDQMEKIEELLDKMEEYERLSQAAEEASSSIVMDETCDNCEAPLRRTERLREHPNQPRRRVFEAVVECDCDEHVLGATSTRLNQLPEGWQ